MPGFTKPANAILVAGTPIQQELEVEAADTIKAGDFVIKGTADYQIGVAGDGAKNPLGIADYDSRYTWGADYPAGAYIRVLSGPIVVVGVLAKGQSVNKGDALVCAANGELKAAADIAVAVPSGTTTVTSTAAQPDLTESGSTPPGGVIVGYAEETVDASAAAKSIMVRLVT